MLLAVRSSFVSRVVNGIGNSSLNTLGKNLLNLLRDNAGLSAALGMRNTLALVGIASGMDLQYQPSISQN